MHQKLRGPKEFGDPQFVTLVSAVDSTISHAVELVTTKEGVYVFLGDQEVWIELNEHKNLVVHAYDETHDDPTSIEITGNDCFVTRRDE